MVPNRLLYLHRQVLWKEIVWRCFHCPIEGPILDYSSPFRVWLMYFRDNPGDRVQLKVRLNLIQKQILILEDLRLLNIWIFELSTAMNKSEEAASFLGLAVYPSAFRV